MAVTKTAQTREKFAETLECGLESAYILATLDTLVRARFIDVFDDLARGRAAMSYVVGTPETIASAASDASKIGSRLAIPGSMDRGAGRRRR